jgi:homoserine O-succinyltransferase
MSTRAPLVIGLVNNMPDAALLTTEHQFRDVLGAAGTDYEIQLRIFSFPELIRGEAGRAYVTEHYEPIDALWSDELDAFIVTGAEPRTPTLAQEAYWQSLTQLIEFASDTATPTIWSCLAAHAAVLHLDGIQRRPLGEKISGLFRCARASDHRLLSGLPASWCIPHSRLNTLDPAELVEAGYEILSLSEGAGVDSFMLRRRAPFVFFQGHPEYDAAALLREYRRDVGRFLAGAVERYPEMPRGYFDDETAVALNAFRARAQRQRTHDLLAEFPDTDAREKLEHQWHDVAVRLYRNWLTAVAEHQSDGLLTTGSALPASAP